MKIQLSSIAKNDILLYARKYKSDDSSLGQKFLEEIKLKAIQISENPEQSEIIYENIRIIALDSFPNQFTLHFRNRDRDRFHHRSFRQENIEN